MPTTQKDHNVFRRYGKPAVQAPFEKEALIDFSCRSSKIKLKRKRIITTVNQSDTPIFRSGASVPSSKRKDRSFKNDVYPDE